MFNGATAELIGYGKNKTLTNKNIVGCECRGLAGGWQWEEGCGGGVRADVGEVKWLAASGGEWG